MILSAMFIFAVFVVVCLIVLGAIGVWMRDEHPPLWLPPEPRHVGTPKPGPYDQELEDELWLSDFLSEHTDDTRRPPD